MPDANGRLSKEELEKAQEFLSRKSGPTAYACDFCGSTDWTLNDRLSAMPEAAASPLKATSQVPVLCLFCDNCGHIKLFAAGWLGLKPQQDETSNTEEVSDGN